MFLQVSVIHSVHRGGVRGFIGGACVVLFGGACVVLFGGCVWFYSGGCAWFYLGGVHGFIRGGVRGFIRGACVVLFGGRVWFYSGGRAWFYSGGACVVFSVFSDTMRYGQWAGGTHPTGMHSCYVVTITVDHGSPSMIVFVYPLRGGEGSDLRWGAILSRGVLWRGCSEGPLVSVNKRRYASYWNAFLFIYTKSVCVEPWMGKRPLKGILVGISIHRLPPANEVWGKIIFLHLSVILFMGGEGSTWAGTPPQGRYIPLGRYTPSPSRYTPGRYTPLGRYTPPGQVHPPLQCMLGYGQQAGGTHPTGMHSCFVNNTAINIWSQAG